MLVANEFFLKEALDIFPTVVFCRLLKAYHIQHFVIDVLQAIVEIILAFLAFVYMNNVASWQ
jgi:hypothetical protein